jgi:hypothetical protein
MKECEKNLRLSLLVTEAYMMVAIQASLEPQMVLLLKVKFT